MGRSITPKYKVTVDGQTMCWRGRANQAELEKYIFAYAKSLELGGCNDHVSKMLGYVPYPQSARIEFNDDFVHENNPVAVWKAAPFQVY